MIESPKGYYLSIKDQKKLLKACGIIKEPIVKKIIRKIRRGR